MEAYTERLCIYTYTCKLKKQQTCVYRISNITLKGLFQSYNNTYCMTHASPNVFSYVPLFLVCQFIHFETSIYVHPNQDNFLGKRQWAYFWFMNKFFKLSFLILMIYTWLGLTYYSLYKWAKQLFLLSFRMVELPVKCWSGLNENLVKL